jgi:hypothetical protein
MITGVGGFVAEAKFILESVILLAFMDCWGKPLVLPPLAPDILASSRTGVTKAELLTDPSFLI